MNAITTCFPSSTALLCLWHANKAVLRYCQPAFTGQQDGLEAWNEFYKHWHLIMRSPDEQTFYKRVEEFGKQYLPDYLQEVGYIKTTWLDPYKEKLVKAWDRSVDEALGAIGEYHCDLDANGSENALAEELGSGLAILEVYEHMVAPGTG